MYKNILLPTDGSELAGKAVQYGIAFAKEIGAKVTVLTVSLPFHVFTFEMEMVEDTSAEYKKRANERAMKTLGAAANKAKTAGVTCERFMSSRNIPTGPSLTRPDRRAVTSL